MASDVVVPTGWSGFAVERSALMPMSSERLTVSVMYPMSPHVPDAVDEYAASVATSDASRLWLGQSLLLDPGQVAARLAGQGIRVPFGSGVGLTALQHPLAAAMAARSVAVMTGHPYVAGFGPGAPEFQRGMLGTSLASPLSAMIEFLTITRGLLEGEHVTLHGRHHTCDASLPALDHPGVELGLGVLRSRMARTAGAIADVAISWLTPAAYVHDHLVPGLEAGAAEADREGRPRLATMVPVVLDRPGRDPRRMAYAATHAHLHAAHYRETLRMAGAPIDLDDPDTTTDGLLRAGVVLFGTAEEIVDGLLRYRDAGVDEVVLNPIGVFVTEGVAAGLADLTEITEAVRRRR